MGAPKVCPDPSLGQRHRFQIPVLRPGLKARWQKFMVRPPDTGGAVGRHARIRAAALFISFD